MRNSEAARQGLSARRGAHECGKNGLRPILLLSLVWMVVPVMLIPVMLMPSFGRSFGADLLG